MSSIARYFSDLFKGIYSLLKGMSVTIVEFFTPKVTQQYPENRKTLVISDRFRAVLRMPHDENNEHECTACGICQMNCPNGTIQVVSQMVQNEDGKKKRVLDKYIYHLGQCTFCNICVISCPSNAIEFSNDFESAVYTRSKLTMKLNNEGSKLKEKVKPAAQAPKKEVETAAKPEKEISETPKAESEKEDNSVK